MNLTAYLDQRQNLSMDEVSLGYRTVYLFSPERLNSEQVGYSIDPDGRDLTGKDIGDWKKSWLVIGYEDLNGDPIFIDLSVDGYPVYTSVHGEGEWKPWLISTSLSGFLDALEKIEQLGKGRRNPVELRENPIHVKERNQCLREIHELTKSDSNEFWESWFEA